MSVELGSGGLILIGQERRIRGRRRQDRRKSPEQATNRLAEERRKIEQRRQDRRELANLVKKD